MSPTLPRRFHPLVDDHSNSSSSGPDVRMNETGATAEGLGHPGLPAVREELADLSPLAHLQHPSHPRTLFTLRTHCPRAAPQPMTAHA